MGTHSTINFKIRRGGKEQPLVKIYQQYDGYLKGVGYQLIKFLASKKIINGYNLEMTMEKGYCNGFDCLVAQFIKEFKTKIGGLYITTQDDEEEWNYEVIYDYDKPNEEDRMIVKVENIIGTPRELLNTIFGEEVE